MKAGLLTRIKRVLIPLCLAPYGFTSGPVVSAELDLAQAPLGNTYGGPPNVMLLIDTSRSMRKRVFGSQSKRIDTARKVAQELVRDNPKVRFGLARLNEWHGGIIDCPIGKLCVGYKDKEGRVFPEGERLTARLNRYEESMLTLGTPITEAMYEVTRYFRGMTSFDYFALNPRLLEKHLGVAYRDTQYIDPRQHRCQKNNVIVLTDGQPYEDNDLPTDDPFDTKNDAALPDWDGKSDLPSSGKTNKGKAWYLDDLAKFAWELEQNIHTYTVGFAADFTMLKDAADYGHGQYQFADTAEGLSKALAEAIEAIKSESSSSSAVAANSGRVGKGSRIFQARYDARDWTGQLLAYDIITDPADGEVGRLKEKPAWDAGTKIPLKKYRSIITNNKAKGIGFRWVNFNIDEQQAIFNGDRELFRYISGKDVARFRQRSSKLGDIVNSSPVYVAQPNARYRDNLETISYKSFRDKHQSRKPMLYVGANDGMLHGFDAGTGEEKLAYIPGHLLPKIKHLADPEYRHQYYVDGSPTVVDAFVDQAWKTILVGGLNAGGQSVYALDITDPSKFSKDNADDLFLWEFTDQEDPDLGYTFSKPAIVKIKTETDGNADKWYAVFGNGYNNTEADGAASESGDAVIFIVDLATGKLASKITTGIGREEDPTGQERPNGMATLTPVDVDGDGDSIADAIYGGDLFGNVWKVDLSGGIPQNMSKASRLFTACAANRCEGKYQPQPITTQLAVNQIDGNIIVLFGTGKYIETTDSTASSAEIQSFYGIWDQGEGLSGREDLQQQTIKQKLTVSYTNSTDGETYEYVLRTTSDNKPESNIKGWFIDLVTPVVSADVKKLGEQVIHRPVLRNGRVIFVTTTPAEESCGKEGNSWLMELDQATGGRPAINVFDLNKDGVFNSGDTVLDSDGNTIPVSGEQQSGNVASPTILDGDNGVEYKYLSGDSGINVVKENSGGNSTGRQKWLQFKR